MYARLNFSSLISIIDTLNCLYYNNKRFKLQKLERVEL